MNTDTDTVTERPPLGRDMAHRARQQTVLGHRWSPAGSVGAVGRASVGFSLAVGRSRAIRPAVRYEDLNSAALRPSLEGWRMVRAQHAAPADDVQPGETPASRQATVEPARSPRAARGRREAGSRRSAHRPAVPIRRQPSRPARPTWTDQVIERSGIGYTRPAAVAAREPSAATLPADFVPSGDPAIDRLRLLVMAQDGRVDAAQFVEATDGRRRPAASPATASRGGGSSAETSRDLTAPTAPTAPTTAAAAPDAAGTVTPGRPAPSGPAPGALARALRPERIEPGQRPAGVAGTRPATAPRPTASATGTAPAATAASRPTSARRKPAAGPADKLDDLRAALVAQGFFTDDRGAADDDGAPDAVARESAPAPGREDLSDRPAVRRRDGQQAAPQGQPAARPGAPGSADDGTSPGRAARPTPSLDTPGVVRRSAPAPDRSTPGPAARDGAARDGAATTRATSPAAGDDPVSPAAVDRGGWRTATDEAVASTGRRPVTDERRQLRAARLLTADGRPRPIPPSVAASSAGVGVLDRDTSDERPGVVRRSPAGTADHTVRPVRSAASVDAADDGSADVGPSSASDAPVAPPAVTLRRRAIIPALPGALPAAADGATLAARPTAETSVDHRSVGEPVLRRVSLPRALSRTHRPPAVLEARAVMPTSTVTPSEVASVRARRAGETSEGPRPVRTGALLDVVRRARAADPTAANAPSIAPASDAGSPAASAAPTVESQAAPAASPVATSPTAAEEVADRFLSELSRSVRARPTPLPTSFRPLADAIAGPRPVMLSTDAASRRALRSVGKVAATTGDTIHLDDRAVGESRLNEVMAHELTHIAAPSPVPRFFDDIDDSPEERRAERIGRIMATSPIAPTASLAAVRDTTIRRSPDPDAPVAGSDPSSLRADDLVAQLAGAPGRSRTGRRPARALAIGSHRQRAVAPPPPPPGAPASTPAAVAGAAVAGSHVPGGPVAGAHRAGVPAAPAPAPLAGASGARSLQRDKDASDWFRDQLDANLDRLLHLIEDRMIVELERRGGRTWRSP